MRFRFVTVEGILHVTMTFSTGFEDWRRFGEMVRSTRPVATEALARREKGSALPPDRAALKIYKDIINPLVPKLVWFPSLILVRI